MSYRPDKPDIIAYPPYYRMNEPERKPIWVTAQGVRFYMRDGWTERDILNRLVSGSLIVPNPKDPSDMQYYTPTRGSVMDIYEIRRIINVCHRHDDGMPDNVSEILIDFYGGR